MERSTRGRRAPSFRSAPRRSRHRPSPASRGRAAPGTLAILLLGGGLLLAAALLLGGLPGGGGTRVGADRRGEDRVDAVRERGRTAGLDAAPGSAAGSPGRPLVCATILSTNDAHGRLAPETPAWANGREVGGVAVLGGHFRRIRERAGPCPVFTFSAGDILQGTAASAVGEGEGMIAAFDALGYDAAAVGNHEFDWGVPALEARAREASFPFLAANVHERGTDDHPAWARPYALLERDGVVVGVVGALTRSTPWTTRPEHVAALEFRSIAAALDRYIPELRARGADFVVVLLHAAASCPDDDGGGAEGGASGCEGEAIEALERAEASFDYAVTGHNHTRVRTTVRGAPVVQSFAHTTAFAVGRLERGADGRRSGSAEIRTAWADAVDPDPELAALADRYRARVADRMERRVAVLASPLRRRGREHALGRLVADAQRRATDARVAIMNDGGIRADLPAGPVTREDLFRVLPFQNGLLRCRLPGRLLLETLEQGVEEDGPHVHVSGLRLRYDPDRPAGRRLLAAILDDGTRVRPEALYTVTVNDFMAAGGSGFTALRRGTAGGSRCRRTGIGDLEALVSHLRSLPRPVQAPAEARWVPSTG